MSDKPAVHLRFLSVDQHKAIVAEAKEEGRSLNNYLIYLIEQARKKRKAKR